LIDSFSVYTLIARAHVKKHKVLDKVVMFGSLTRKSKNSLIMVMEQNKYNNGASLCVQGEFAGEYFVVVVGCWRLYCGCFSNSNAHPGFFLVFLGFFFFFQIDCLS